MFGSIITIKSIAYQHIPFQQRYIGISFSSVSKVVFSHGVCVGPSMKTSITNSRYIGLVYSLGETKKG